MRTRIAWIPDAAASLAADAGAKELARVAGGAVMAMDAAPFLAALEQDLPARLLALTGDEYDSLSRGLSALELDQAVRRRLSTSDRWPDFANGIATTNEVAALRALLDTPKRNTPAIARTLETLADIVGFRRYDLMGLETLLATAIEDAYALLAGISDIEAEAAREGTLAPIEPFLRVARAIAAARAAGLARLGARRRGIAGEPLPHHIEPPRGVHFPAATAGLLERLHGMQVPFAPIDKGCVAVLIDVERSRFRASFQTRLVSLDGRMVAAAMAHLTPGELREHLRGLVGDPSPVALRLLRLALGEAIPFRALEIVLARTAARAQAETIAAFSADGEAFLSSYDAMRAAADALGESRAVADLIALERDSLDDLLLLRHLTARRGDVPEMLALVADLERRKRADLEALGAGA